MSIEIYKDCIAEQIDELADLLEVWKKWREKGVMPPATRRAVLMTAEELIAMVAIESLKYGKPAEIKVTMPAPPQACA